MKRQLRRLAAGLLLTGLCCSALLCTGCGSGNSGGQKKEGPCNHERRGHGEVGGGYTVHLGTV